MQSNCKIFIGYDPREKLAYDVAEHSIKKNTQSKVEILPLKIEELDILTRPIEQKDGRLWCPISQAAMATEFAISRFCVPFLTKGWALFMDCDMVVMSDIQKLFDLADDRYAVMVVKHKQESGSSIKMDNQVQSYYSRKNWSSVVLWNCDHPSNNNLTKAMLNSLPGRDLHAFCWLKENEIGELPKSWNHLIDIDDKNDKIDIAHYTLGCSCLPGWGARESDKYFNEALKEMQGK